MVEGAPALVSESEGMLLELTVDLSGASSSQNGYLFARADGRGSTFFSLYATSVKSSGTRDLKIYYRTRGSDAVFSSTLSTNYPATGSTTLRLAIDEISRRGLKVSRATLAIVGVAGGISSKNLVGVVDDCGPASADCATHLLQRQPTAGIATPRQGEGYIFTGACVTNAALSP